MKRNIVLDELTRSLIVITGISASGKSVLAKKLSTKYSYPLLSLDDYKVSLYEKYGFISEEERKGLWNLAKGTFCADVLSYVRKGQVIIIEYPFDKSWQKFFDYITEQYQYKSVIIYCNSRDFDDIWNSRMKRDLECIERSKCLTASKYIKDILYESNNKLNAEYKEIKRKEYMNNKYTSIIGDTIISDGEIKDI